MARVDIYISSTILDRRGGLAIDTDSVGDALMKIVGRFGGKLKIDFFDDKGRLNKFIEVFVNGKNIDLLDGLQTKLLDGDRVNIMRVVSGG